MTTRSSDSGAGPNWKVAQPPKQRSVQPVAVAGFLVILILIFVAIAALLFNRPVVLIVIAVCALILLSILLLREPLRWAIRDMREHKWRTLAAAVLCGLSFLFALVLLSFVGSPALSPVVRL
jgi:ACR3 family arsenite efflux pump ArsB